MESTSGMIYQHQLVELAQLVYQGKIRIPGQSINFDDVPLIQSWNFFRNQRPEFSARLARIPSNLPVTFPEYSHSRISWALAEHVSLWKD
jgi:hypothetical protein